MGLMREEREIEHPTMQRIQEAPGATEIALTGLHLRGGAKSESVHRDDGPKQKEQTAVSPGRGSLDSGKERQQLLPLEFDNAQGPDENLPSSQSRAVNQKQKREVKLTAKKTAVCPSASPERQTKRANRTGRGGRTRRPCGGGRHSGRKKGHSR